MPRRSSPSAITRRTIPHSRRRDSRTVALVQGDQGLGKSRLLREVDRSARLHGIRVLESAGHAGTTLPFSALRELLERLEILDDPIHGERIAAVHEALRDLGRGESQDLERAAAKVSQVSILFRPVPHQSFPSTAVENWQPNRLVIRIQPEEGITLRIQAKQPGTRMVLGPVDMQFCYRDAFRATSPEAYETLLLDVMRGDATLFMRADQVETAWSVIAPVLETWEGVPPADFPDYRAGSWGPETADALLTQDGRNWFAPVSTEPGVLSAPKLGASSSDTVTLD